MCGAVFFFFAGTGSAISLHSLGHQGEKRATKEVERTMGKVLVRKTDQQRSKNREHSTQT